MNIANWLDGDYVARIMSQLWENNKHYMTTVGYSQYRHNDCMPIQVEINFLSFTEAYPSEWSSKHINFLIIKIVNEWNKDTLVIKH